MSQSRRAPDAGLSLIEVLVSLTIFAVIGVAGLAVLNTVARTGERTEGRLERLADIDRTFLIIRRDLMQMQGAEVTLDGGSLRFRRQTEEDPVGVAYLLQEDRLTRQIDRPGQAEVDQLLLEGVARSEWSLMDAGRSWQQQWPPGVDGPPTRPRAAELALTLTVEGQGAPQTVTRLFTLMAGQGR
ncbi:MAG: type II secretion system protein GspJ [Sulfitobacter sp.]|nr:type II secretion system protein GspJ [Sulfitobacter sp.]